MDQYTPTTKHVRDAFIGATVRRPWYGGSRYGNPSYQEITEAGENFDRWLAEHDAELTTSNKDLTTTDK